MATRHFVIFADDGPWRVAWTDAAGGIAVAAAPDAAGAGEEDLAEAAVNVRRLLDENGYAGGGVVLAVPSSWCLCAAVPLLEASGHRDLERDALLYRFEEHWPVAAEDVAAGFVLRDGFAFGVAVLLRRLRPLVIALEGTGVCVEHISPSALLALGDVMADVALETPDEAPADDGHLVIWRCGPSYECFGVSRDTPRDWSVLPDDDALRRHLAVRTVVVGRPPRVLWVDESAGTGDEGARELPAGLPTTEIVHRRTFGLTEAAARRGLLCAEGKARPMADLRTGPLAADRLRAVRRPLAWTTAAAAVLLIASAGAMLWRAHGYDRLAAAAERRQDNAYAEAFPGRPTPTGALLVLESEARKLEALGGGAGGASDPLPRQVPMLAALRDLLAALPADLRYRLLELRLEPEGLLLEGEARSHGDADALAAALRDGGRFDPQAPRTEQRGDGDAPFVSFNLAAGIRPPDAAVREGTRAEVTR